MDKSAQQPETLRMSRYASDRKHANRIVGLLTWLEAKRIRTVRVRNQYRVMAFVTLTQLAKFAAEEARVEGRK